jgi:autotransporter-associated beta strand protein
MAGNKSRRFLLKVHPRRKQSQRVCSLELLELRTFLSGSQIVMGPPTDIYDQPYVDVEFRDGAHGLGPYSTDPWGLYPYSHLLLDTGANSINLVSDAAQELVDNGLNNDGTYSDIGVAGATDFGLSTPLQLKFTGTDGVAHTLPQTSQDVRILTNPDFEYGAAAADGGVPGLVGMPAMINRVTTLDTSNLLNLEPLGVSFSDTLPASSTGHRYSVSTDTRVTFNPRDGLPAGSSADAPVPSWGDVNFVTATLSVNGVTRKGAFLVDTGAQMSVMSPELAISLGLDPSQPDDTITVLGVGGQVDLPVLAVDSLGLTTDQGPDLVWKDTSNSGGFGLLVEDIAPGIDGVLGSDLLTAGLGLDFDTLDITGTPYFDKINFDFRNVATQGTGKLVFDLNPQYDTNVKTWAGPAGGNWNNAANWSGGVPQLGDILFLQSATPANSVNDLSAGYSVGELSLSGNVTITGNSVVLDAAGGTAIENAAGQNTLGLASQLASDGAIRIAAGQLAITGGIDTNGYQLTVDVASGAAGRINGAITGTGGLRMQGAGTLSLHGANTYSGDTTVTAGTLIVDQASGLADGSSLAIDGGSTKYFTTAASSAAVVSPTVASAIVPTVMPTALTTSSSRGLPMEAWGVLLPSHVTFPTSLPPQVRVANPSAAIALLPQAKSLSTSLSRSTETALRHAAADAVFAAGLSSPEVDLTRLAACAVLESNSMRADLNQRKASFDATLLTQMTVARE